ncbi:peptidoglycan-binding domain-containing protein [Hirschia baltica]|uniref:Peptidoglycan-binding domain 1 protein n=1 Tax=Hirschia baltica (strain ATCC 49814 / DSM 5838 / IFAM 1418) TaxID=582402 RepID=C6XR47_HIRBI|nr:peptidoglycan-binding protein [Hirschia baltica]ACT60578.1 Peptidoglycan-binding domain 1 protein [Hirschia baltica ATCC 49814]
MKKKLLAAAAIAIGFAGSAQAAGPHANGHSAFSPAGALPDAQAGQCFARITLPAAYDIVPETVVVEDAHERLVVNDTQFGPSSIDVQVKDQGVRYEVRQPVYETVTEQVLVKPAHERLQVIAARFEDVTETIIVEEARKVWKAGTNLSSHRKIDEQTGQVYCLVDVPAKTRTVTRRVMVQPEQVTRIPVEAQYATVQKQVLVDRGGVAEIPTPPEFKTLSTQEIISPASTSRSMTAPRTAIVERTVLRAPERFEWVEVLCDTNAQTSSISDLQIALRDRGFYSGPIDGIIGTQTEEAVRQFQAANGLPHQGFVTMETMRHLGLGGGISSRQAISSHSQTSSYSEPVYTAPVQNHVQNQSHFQPEIMPQSHIIMPQAPAHEVILETREAERHNAYQAPVRQVLHEKKTMDRAESMASEFEAYAAAVTGRQAADQMLEHGVSSYSYMSEEELLNAEHEIVESGDELIRQPAPLTSQKRFQRPQEYSVRNRLNWDEKSTN